MGEFHETGRLPVSNGLPSRLKREGGPFRGITKKINPDLFEAIASEQYNPKKGGELPILFTPCATLLG